MGSHALAGPDMEQSLECVIINIVYVHVHAQLSKLRAKLGLKPLDVGDSKASSSSKDSGKTDADTNGKGQTTGNSEAIKNYGICCN